MADEHNRDQERTEQPTPKRLAEARKKGQVPRSRDWNTTAVMLTAAGGLMALQEHIGEGLGSLMQDGFDFGRAEIMDSGYLTAALGGTVITAVQILLPFFGLVLVAALVGPILLGGWSFSTEALALKLDKLNPVRGLRRVFGPQGLMELAKALAKFVVVAAVTLMLLAWLAERFLALGEGSVPAALGAAAELTGLCLLLLSGALLLIAGVDVPFQLWQHRRQLRMTRQELRDESKDTEGKPEVRSRIRALQQELASRRMMEEIPTADVVVTNPTHFAVALRYEAETMRAPRVVAKGTDLVAGRIRGVAREHGVPLFEQPALARVLYRTVRMGEEIPASLYVAVAQILTYVYQLKHHAELGGPPPEPPRPEVMED